MDYLQYFDLDNEPFANSPVNRFYYKSAQHEEALKRLAFVVEGMKGLATCIGDIGHGKTTLARHMLDWLLERNFEAAMLVIVHGGVSPSWLLRRIAIQLGIPDPGEEKLTILSKLYQRLVEIHESGKKAVVLIDEAQMLSTRELMEEFRGMLNLEIPGHKLISFVLFGLPELDKNLKLDPPLAQRVALNYKLKPFDVANSAAYIRFRLKQAGAKRELFSPEAINGIHKASKGIPRVINTLCDNSLLEAYLCKQNSVDLKIVSQVAENLSVLNELTAETVSQPEEEPPSEAVTFVAETSPIPNPPPESKPESEIDDLSTTQELSMDELDMTNTQPVQIEEDVDIEYEIPDTPEKPEQIQTAQEESNEDEFDVPIDFSDDEPSEASDANPHLPPLVPPPQTEEQVTTVPVNENLVAVSTPEPAIPPSVTESAPITAPTPTPAPSQSTPSNKSNVDLSAVDALLADLENI